MRARGPHRSCSVAGLDRSALSTVLRLSGTCQSFPTGSTIVVMTMFENDELSQLARDARDRGFVSVDTTIRGVIYLLSRGDPNEIGYCHGMWVQTYRQDGLLSRLLGTAEDYMDDTAFYVGVCIRVIRAMEARIQELTTPR